MTMPPTKSEKGKSMIIRHAQKTVDKFPRSPRENAKKISPRSLFIPSTASSILPSLPRNALPLPQILVIVDRDTQAMLEHIETTAAKCSKQTANLGVVSGICISIKQVVVNPANTAACVAMAEKLSVYKLSSCVQ